MEYIQYLLWVVVAIVILYPIIFADRSPIPETSTKIHKLTSLSELTDLTSKHENVMIDFYADWCPPCRAIAPVFGKLADEFAVEGKLGFAKVNVDHVKDVAAKYDIRAMPTFLVLRKGEKRELELEGKRVGEVRGADVRMLRNVVYALAEEARGI